MSIRAGSAVFVGGGVAQFGRIIDRAQQAGPGTVSRSATAVKELGNQLNVDFTYDIPNFSFDLRSWDATVEPECFINRVDPASVSAGTTFSFLNAKPLTIVSPITGPYGTYTSVRGVATPYLTLSRAQFRFGVAANYEATYSFAGDSIFYAQSTPWYERLAGTGGATYSFTHGPAIRTVDGADTIYALDVCVYYADGSHQRLFFGDDYTNTSTGFTLLVPSIAPVGSTVDVTYTSAVTTTIAQSDHPTATQKPGAVRGRNVEISVSDGAATPTWTTFKGIQTVDLSWAVTLESDQELGNSKYVAQDYDSPTVSGTVTVRGSTAKTLFNTIAKVSGVTAADGGDTINVNSKNPVDTRIDILHPTSGLLMKRFEVPAAIFDPPPYNPQVGQKLDLALPFSSLTGDMDIVTGPAGLPTS